MLTLGLTNVKTSPVPPTQAITTRPQPPLTSHKHMLLLTFSIIFVSKVGIPLILKHSSTTAVFCP